MNGSLVIFRNVPSWQVLSAAQGLNSRLAAAENSGMEAWRWMTS